MTVKYNPKEPKTNVNKNKANPIFFVGNTEKIKDISDATSGSIFLKSAFNANPINNGIGNRADQHVLRNDVYKGSNIPDNMTGYIFLNFGSTWPAAMRSCIEAPCSNPNNVLTSSINYQ